MKKHPTFEDLIEIMSLLRSPDGCPWDREQTPQSIKHNLLEEACEAMDAIDSGDNELIREELGDLLLQVVFQSQMAAEKGFFSVHDVVSGIVNKLKRRHPHIFGDLKLETAAEVLRNWEAIKTKEKEEFSHLESVPQSLPALLLAQKLQNRASRFGFDWPDSQDVLPKLSEEIAELLAADRHSPSELEEEFGDILFTLVNLSRHLGIESESALRRVANKFRRRFAAMEELAKARGLNFAELSLAEKDKLWEEVKNA